MDIRNGRENVVGSIAGEGLREDVQVGAPFWDAAIEPGGRIVAGWYE
jgi:hypothetical protein